MIDDLRYISCSFGGFNLTDLNDATTSVPQFGIPGRAGDVGEGKQDICVEEREMTARVMPK